MPFRVGSSRTATATKLIFCSLKLQQIEVFGLNFNAVQNLACKKLYRLLGILSACLMISGGVLLPCTMTVNAVDTLYISSSVDETSITQVGGSYRPFVVQTTVNGGTSPFTLSYYYRVLGEEDWIQSGSSIELETVNNLPVSNSREIYIMNTGKYQIMVHCIDSDLHTDTYILNVEVNRIATPEPDWLIGSDKISIPNVSFEFSDFAVNSEGIGVFASSFSSFVPSEFIAILPVVVLLLFVGWWLRK